MSLKTIIGLILAVVVYLPCTVAPAEAEPSSVELPAGVVAVISSVPRDLGTITERELTREIATAAAGVSPPPQPGQPKYEGIEHQAFGELLDFVDIQGEATEEGLSVTQEEISAELHWIKKEDFKSKAAYQHFLHNSKLTEKDVRERVKLQLLSTLIQERATRGVHGFVAQQKAFSKFVREYSKRWKARTVCAPQYATVRCSNGELDEPRVD